MGFGMDYGHLISISLDKISSETEMDLRKTVLVANVVDSIQKYSNEYVNKLRYNQANSKQQHDEALKDSQVSSSHHQPRHPEEVIEAPEVVIGGDDLDVSACCEIESTPLSDNEDDSVDDDVIVRTSSPLKRSSPSPMGPPLPKKKRPLPKEVLESCMMKDDTDDDEDCFPGCFDVSMEEDEDTEDADDEEEDYASKLCRSSMEDYVVTPPSITSTSVSTSSRPKVLVQVTHSARYHQLNSWNRMYLHQPQSQPKHHPQPSDMAASATGLLF